MKVFAPAVVLGLLATISSAIVVPKELQKAAEKRQNVEWDFTIYQNTQCTGASDRYSGVETTNCRQGIRNGSGAAIIKRFMDPDNGGWTVELEHMRISCTAVIRRAARPHHPLKAS